MALDQQAEELQPALPEQEGDEPATSLSFSSDQILNEIKRSKRNRVAKAVAIALAIAVVAAALAAAILMGFAGTTYTVKDGSMAPALEQGQVVLVDDSQAVADDDIVVCRTLSGEIQMRRVIAGPGEWVNLASDGTYVVSSVPLTSDAISQLASPEATLVDSQQLPMGVYFVLADSAEGSLEALNTIDNLVTADQMIGVVTMRVLPPLPIASRN